MKKACLAITSVALAAGNVAMTYVVGAAYFANEPEPVRASAQVEKFVASAGLGRQELYRGMTLAQWEREIDRWEDWEPTEECLAVGLARLLTQQVAATHPRTLKCTSATFCQMDLANRRKKFPCLLHYSDQNTRSLAKWVPKRSVTWEGWRYRLHPTCLIDLRMNPGACVELPRTR